MAHRAALRTNPVVINFNDISGSSELDPVNHPTQSLIDIKNSRHQTVEFLENGFFNELCGQVVQEEVVLLAGAPGSNKSTLARQLVLDRVNQGKRALMILTEESAERAKSGFLAMTGEMPSDKVKAALGRIDVETGLHDANALPDFFVSRVLNRQGAYHGISMVVLDSIQGPGLSANAAAWKSVIKFFQFAREAHIMTLAICHVTKRGEIAGPKALEHAVDCTVLIRKAHNRRVVSVLKNRFGPETTRPMQLQIDPVTLRLQPAPHAETFTATARGYLPLAGVTDVQGAVTLPKPGAAARVVAPGLPRKEIEQYVAGLCQVPGFELADFDLSIQCRVPGERQYRSVLGLPLCMALASSYTQQPVPAHHLYLGEIDLCRTVRDVPEALLNELARSIADGEVKMPLTIYCPPTAVRQLPSDGGIEIVRCRTLDDAIFNTWPTLR